MVARLSLVSLALWITGFAGRADEISLASCPEAVRVTIESRLNGGEVDEIKKVAVGDHVLYLVEIDLRGFREIKLQVRGDGSLQKYVEEIRFHELPESVRAEVTPLLVGLKRVDDVEKVIIDGQTRYHVEIKSPQMPDQDLVFDENGAVFSQK